MIQTVLLHILAGIAGLWIAIRFVPGVEFTGSTQLLLIAGFILGILNATIKPLLNLLTLPIRILTLGLSGLVINLLLVWSLDLLFSEIEFIGFLPLLWTTLIVWLITIPLSLLSKGKV
ncbi:MAG: phage holin family protein [Patescibacteria group bacterium]